MRRGNSLMLLTRGVFRVYGIAMSAVQVCGRSQSGWPSCNALRVQFLNLMHYEDYLRAAGPGKRQV